MLHKELLLSVFLALLFSTMTHSTIIDWFHSKLYTERSKIDDSNKKKKKKKKSSHFLHSLLIVKHRTHPSTNYTFHAMGKVSFFIHFVLELYDFICAEKKAIVVLTNFAPGEIDACASFFACSILRRPSTKWIFGLFFFLLLHFAGGEVIVISHIRKVHLNSNENRLWNSSIAKLHRSIVYRLLGISVWYALTVENGRPYSSTVWTPFFDLIFADCWWLMAVGQCNFPIFRYSLNVNKIFIVGSCGWDALVIWHCTCVPLKIIIGSVWSFVNISSSSKMHLKFPNLIWYLLWCTQCYLNYFTNGWQWGSACFCHVRNPFVSLNQIKSSIAIELCVGIFALLHIPYTRNLYSAPAMLYFPWLSSVDLSALIYSVRYLCARAHTYHIPNTDSTHL